MDEFLEKEFINFQYNLNNELIDLEIWQTEYINTLELNYE